MNKTANVDISFINPAKPGKKMGSIKTRDNILYWVYSDKLAQFRTGPCTIEYNDDPGNDGKPFLKALGVVGGNPAQQPLPNQMQAAVPVPNVKSWPKGDTQRPHTNGGGNGHNKDEMIFVMNQMAAAINAGQVVVGSAEYIPFLNKVRSAYSATFGADE